MENKRKMTPLEAWLHALLFAGAVALMIWAIWDAMRNGERVEFRLPWMWTVR